MKTEIEKQPLILASASPRRSWLLKQAGLDFQVIPSRFDESSIKELNPGTLVRTLAEAKAVEIATQHPACWVIGADTIVLIGNQVLGKPESTSEARNMLRQLSGRTHQVLTGFCICNQSRKKRIADIVTTDVHFKELADVEIEWYIRTREPFDKAGAYAIQGLGAFLVRAINGSYTNVVGLPVCEVIECLRQENVLGFQNGSSLQGK
jgi:septum formation protein